jgi:hypothetical protein
MVRDRPYQPAPEFRRLRATLTDSRIAASASRGWGRKRMLSSRQNQHTTPSRSTRYCVGMSGWPAPWNSP